MIGVKYCGGCNPKYNRIKFVEDLKKEIGIERFLYGENMKKADIILVISGCNSRCVKLIINISKKIINIDEESDLEKVSEIIKSLKGEN